VKSQAIDAAAATEVAGLENDGLEIGGL